MMILPRSVRTAGVLVAGLLLAACDISVDPGPRTFSWHGELVPSAGWDHLAGQGAISWTEGEVEFSAGLFLQGDAAGSVRPWRLHHGSCAAGGAVVAGPEHYPPVTVDEDGEGGELTTVPGTLDTGASYHVSVRRSVDESETIIACGDLSRVPPGG
jgi:hypothetical protein